MSEDVEADERAARAIIAGRLRRYAVEFRGRRHLDQAHRYELRADAIEQGHPFPRLFGYEHFCMTCDGETWNMGADGPEICGACRGRGTLGSPQHTSGETADETPTRTSARG